MKNSFFIKILLFIFLSITVACSDRPSNVLSEKKMVNLMVDMELAEAYANTQNNLVNHDREDIGKRVLEAHGVSEETLDTTLAWYGRNIDEYTDLFDKVDKEIIKKRNKYTEVPGSKIKESDNLWPYGQHLILSPLSGYDSFSFSLLHPEIKKGDIVKLSFYLPNSTGLKNTLGVEYTDGHGEALVTNTSKNKVEIEIQTDTLREVSRVYAIMNVKDKKSLPLYLDSIFVKAEPIDTLNYRSKRRSQKTYGAI